MIRGLIALAAAAAVAGCAGGMKRANCAAADWAALGFADGREGAPLKVSENRLSACAAQGFAVDRTAFAAARREGLAAYCTPAGGFDAGRLGQDYNKVCAPEAEPAFLAGYADGERLYALLRAEQEAERARKAALDALDQHSFLLKAVDKRAMSSTISNEDREGARQEAAYRRRDIARLEQNLPKLEAAIAAARADREAFEAALRASGRIF
ncbi:MAG TPA: hypothetical protein DDZ68_00120 [Parvularcula sp.]|nr:hypothetical protein [Parvularcula sp.]HBS33288.1 hypothetical protein [Parvularcula sp.]HBS34196.1 hypothetical protein [Parvularcula sp.]